MGRRWWSYVQKDLRSLLGRPVSGPYQTRFCGSGDVTRCAASLWAALDQAAAQERLLADQLGESGAGVPLRGQCDSVNSVWPFALPSTTILGIVPWV